MRQFAHQWPNPFPAELKNGKTVIDELCSCGHSRTQHLDTLAFGHGRCNDCACGKFSWKGFIFKSVKPRKKKEAA